MGAEHVTEKSKLLQAVEKTMAELRPVMETSQHLDLVKNPQFAETVQLGLTMQALLEVLRGSRVGLPKELHFDRTAAMVVANRLHESVPAWEIRDEALDFFTNLADAHQASTARLKKKKLQPNPVR